MVARFWRAAVTLVVVGLGASLSGCTSSGEKTPPSATPTRSPSPVPSQHPLPDPSHISNSVKLRRQVEISSCVSTPGGWKAVGSAVNPAKEPVHLTITVFFTTTGATVLDYATTKITVGAGATRKWTAAARFHAEPTMRCVLRGVG